MNKKSRLQFFLIIIFLLGVILALASVSSIKNEQDQRISYTPTSKTVCNDNICTKSIYLGTRFVYEDEMWKPIENARSLKGSNIECVITKDKKDDPDVVCDDWNYTTIKLKDISINKIGTVPIKVYREEFDKTTSYSKMVEDTDKRLNLIFNSVDEKKNIEIKINPGDIIHLGDESTTIQLKDPNSENMDDSFTYSQNPTTNYGSYTFLHIAPTNGRHTFIRWNITSLQNSNATNILEVLLFLNYEDDDIEAGEEIKVTVHHLYNTFDWDEDSITWNSNPSGGTDYNTTYEDSNNFNPSTGNDYYSWNVTKMLEHDFNSGSNNFSVFMNATPVNGGEDKWDYISVTSKDHGTDAIRPYLNITYEEGGGCTNHSDCGSCEKCVGGSCTYQSSSEDLKDECGTTNCYTGNCDGSGSCDIYNNGEEGSCAVCYECNDADSDCDLITSNTQDTTGSYTCQGTCQACQSGSCSNANEDTDPGNDCGLIECDGDAGTPYYYGWSTLTCYYRQDEADSDCDGSGSCKTAADYCPSNGQDGSTGVTCDCADAQQDCSGITAGSCNNGLCGGTANEADGRTAIESGIANSELSSPTIETDMVIYVVYQNGTHKLGEYDKYTEEGNKAWAFNYITGSDTFQNLNVLEPVLYFWENQSLTTVQIETQVSGYINSTN